MKLLHISDIHSDIEMLDKVREYAVKREDLEVIACSGDLLGRGLNPEKTAQANYALNFIEQRIKTKEPVPVILILREILSSEKASKELKIAANNYINIIKELSGIVEKEYNKIYDCLTKFPQQVITIPGNWDAVDYFKFFEEFDIHEKSKEFNGIKFSGYGGDNWIPNIIPVSRTVDFSENELYNFLTKEDPDVAVTHIPPYNMQDKASERDHLGKFSVLSYIRGENPIALLCGHNHKARGISQEGQTFVINSGNLGWYNGSPNQGTFYEIDLDKKGINSVIPCKIVDEQVVIDKTADSLERAGVN